MKTANPQTVAFRKYLRAMMLEDDVKARIREQVLKGPPAVLIAAMTIAAGKLHEETESPQSATVVNVQILQALSSIPRNVIEEYAKTGKLPAEAWAPDARPRALKAVPKAEPGNGDAGNGHK